MNCLPPADFTLSLLASKNASRWLPTRRLIMLPFVPRRPFQPQPWMSGSAGIKNMSTPKIRKNNQSTFTPDELHYWNVSSLWTLRTQIVAAEMMAESRQKFIQKIVTDTAFRDKCIEVLKALDFDEWSLTRRVTLAKSARDHIMAALAACNVPVTTELLKQDFDLEAIALDNDISSDEINQIHPLQSGRALIYQHMDRIKSINSGSLRGLLK